MLHLVVLLPILCTVPGNSFPQRNNPNFDSNFDIESYLEHFDQNVNDPPRIAPNQDYRYIPHRGVMPDYVPPVLQRGHFQPPNIPRRPVFKQREWHSSYQDGNFPHREMEHGAKRVHPPNSMQSHRREWNDHSPNLKMQDFGEHKAPVVIETFFNGEHGVKNPHKDSIGKDSLRGKPVFIKRHPDNPTMNPIVNKDHYEDPEDVQKWKPVSINRVHKQPSGIDSIKNKHQTYPEDYEVPVASTKKSSPLHNKRHGHKKPLLKHGKRPIKKNDQKPMLPDYTDYDLPVVVEEWTKKGTALKREHGHKKPIKSEEIIKKHGKNPIIEQVTESYDYDVPVVGEEWTIKGAVHKKELGHKKQIQAELVEKHRKYPVIEQVTEPYDVPVVVEEWTNKGTVHKKEHGHIKPIKSEEIIKNHGKYPTTEQVTEPYDYDVPVVVEEWTNKGAVHKKEHGHKKPIESEEIIKKHEKNPIIEQVTESYDYDVPVVVEEWISKGTVHKKEHGHEKTFEDELVEKHRKYPVIEQVTEPDYDVPVEPDYDVPVVVKEWTNKGTVHKKEHGHKKTIKAEEIIKKHGKHPLIEQVTEPDYDAPVVVEEWTSKGTVHKKEHGHKKPIKTDEIVKKPEEYPIISPEYEETVDIEDPATKEHKVSNGQAKKSVEWPSMKDPLITKTDYERLQKEPFYRENNEDLNIGKGEVGWPKNLHEKNGIKRIKREIELDHEDHYDLPVVDIQTKNPKTYSPEKTDYMKPVDFEDDFDSPVFEDKTKIATNSKKPEFAKPTNHEDNYMSKVDKTSHERYEEYDPKTSEDHKFLEEALSKRRRGTKKHGHVGKKAPKEKTMGTKPGKDQIVIEKEVPCDVYSRNEWELKNNKMYLPNRIEHNVDEDVHEQPIGKDSDVNVHGYESDMHVRPEDYFEDYSEDYSETNEKPIPGSFEPMDISDTEVVIDSLSIQRENPEGSEIPVLDVFSVKDQANGHNAGVKVMAFNNENGDIDVINIGHKDSNIIQEFDDSGSGDDLDARSMTRSFLPMNSNAWSFMTHVQAHERLKFKSCLTPKNETGNCMPIQMCQVPSAGGTIDDFLRNVCIIDEVFIGICCAEFPVKSVLVDWGQLENSISEPLIDNVQESREPLDCGKLPSSFRNEDSWPWTAHLISSTSDRVFCAGALVNEQYVLTAAHCTSRIHQNRILVHLRSPDSPNGHEEFAVVEIKRHAQYEPRSFRSDIALLKLSRRVSLGNFRRLICIPDGNNKNSVGQTAFLRWQTNFESGVESLQVLSNDECKLMQNAIVRDSELCTEPRNEETTCNTDSGAPLLVEVDGRLNIIGLLSWNRHDCDKRFPAVFTRISSYQKWIQKHAN